MNDYNVLAKFLTDKYIDRVSGRDFPERIVGEDPEKVVMAGTMAEDRNEETFEGGYREDLSKQFESIPSISLSFHIDKKSEGSMRIIPRGLLFYTVLPTYEEVKDYIIRIQSERDHYVYKSIEELKEKYPDIHYQLPQVYKKVAIEDVLKDGIEISLADLTCGKSHLEALINDQLNIIADQIVDEIRIVPDADLNEYYRFIDTCPVCGKKMINVKFNQGGWRLEHICDNPDCEIHALPLYIVDSEIYRYLPSVIVSTIDKMAMVGTTYEFKMLFGQVKNRCKIHGFSGGSKCLCAKAGCKNPLETVKLLKDPIPTLFIQDELHLVKESLGTFDSHYESFLKYYAEKLVPEPQRKKIRYVGATATISMYEEHLNNLYHMNGRRFPCEYPSMQNNRNFYSKTDENDITRIILGYVPYGRSITDSVWQSVLAMKVIVYDMMTHAEDYHNLLKNKYEYQGTVEELKEKLYDYWIELVYNKVKNDVNNLYNAFQNQANNYLEDKGIPKYYPESMTSDTDFQSVRKTLFEIQENRKNLESKNLLLATSTISHGVDEDSFNVMYFFGIPNNNAEYIQAYSRTGRKYTGIVMDLIRLTRVRDRSYLKNFVIFHQNKDDLVEPVPINRWAKNAVYCTLPGLLVAVLYQYYAPILNIENVYSASTWKKVFENEDIDPKEVAQILIEVYGCNDGEKMSDAYREAVIDEVLRICNGLKTYTPGPNEFLSDGISRYSHGNKKPMRSLRDTEEQVTIRID